MKVKVKVERDSAGKITWIGIPNKPEDTNAVINLQREGEFNYTTDENGKVIAVDGIPTEFIAESLTNQSEK